jgi:hypothetical protein
MLLLLLVILELVILSFVSRALTKRLFEAVYLATKARSVAITSITLLLFFGTVVHELSHLFTAGVLGVRTGKLELAPQSIKDEHVHAGSVMIAETDPIRRSLIGLSPLFWGIGVLTALSYFLPSWGNEALISVQNGQFLALSVIRFCLTVFGIFAVSNTMFSSPEDLKGVPAVGITLAIIVGCIYVLGVRITLTDSIADILIRTGNTLSASLAIVLAVNMVILLMAHLLLVLTSRLTKRRIIG